MRVNAGGGSRTLTMLTVNDVSVDLTSAPPSLESKEEKK